MREWTETPDIQLRSTKLVLWRSEWFGHVCPFFWAKLTMFGVGMKSWFNNMLLKQQFTPDCWKTLHFYILVNVEVNPAWLCELRTESFPPSFLHIGVLTLFKTIFWNIQGEEEVLRRAKEARCTCTVSTFMAEMESWELRYGSEVC